MTLIAFATYGRRAELITDSTSYTRGAEQLGRCTKHLTINHLDAAVMTQGSAEFGDQAKSAAWQLGHQVVTFDELIDTLPEFLARLHDQTTARHPDECPEATVALVGYSTSQEKFAGYVCASETGFQPVQVRGLWMLPTPWANQPSDLERTRVAGWMADNPRTDQAMAAWAAAPRRDKPASINEWHELAVDSRVERSLSGRYAHVIVAGDVTHTRLEVGAVTSQRILSFNDQGEEFADLVRGTMHPLALAEPCHCDSGRTLGDCHAAPCPTHPGRHAWECCLVVAVA